MIGIYKLTSPSGKSYIGQSINLKNRLSSYKILRCKKQKKISKNHADVSGEKNPNYGKGLFGNKNGMFGKKRMWINNGEINKIVELSEIIPENWKIGKI